MRVTEFKVIIKDPTNVAVTADELHEMIDDMWGLDGKEDLDVSVETVSSRIETNTSAGPSGQRVLAGMGDRLYRDLWARSARRMRALVSGLGRPSNRRVLPRV